MSDHHSTYDLLSVSYGKWDGHAMRAQLPRGRDTDTWSRIGDGVELILRVASLIDSLTTLGEVLVTLALRHWSADHWMRAHQ